MHGFEFEVNRGHNLAADKYPTKRVPLQWVEGKFFNEKRMLNDGVKKVDRGPVCGFEEGLFKVGVPGKRVDSVVEDKVGFWLSFFVCHLMVIVGLIWVSRILLTMKLGGRSRNAILRRGLLRLLSSF